MITSMCILFKIRLEILTKHINKLLAKKWTDLFQSFFFMQFRPKRGKSNEFKGDERKIKRSD